MADSGAPTYPVINVIHPDSDVSPSEAGIVRIHDELTGRTTFSDSESWLQGIRDRNK